MNLFPFTVDSASRHYQKKHNLLLPCMMIFLSLVHLAKISGLQTLLYQEPFSHSLLVYSGSSFYLIYLPSCLPYCLVFIYLTLGMMLLLPSGNQIAYYSCWFNSPKYFVLSHLINRIYFLYISNFSFCSNTL